MTRTELHLASITQDDFVMSSPPRIHRLRNSQRISELFRDGYRAWDGCATMIAMTNTDGISRLALAVGKKSHGNAVKRNRVKRLCREAFRLSLDEIPAGLDIVYIPRSGRICDIDKVSKSMVALSRRLADKLAKSSQGGEK